MVVTVIGAVVVISVVGCAVLVEAVVGGCVVVISVRVVPLPAVELSCQLLSHAQLLFLAQVWYLSIQGRIK